MIKFKPTKGRVLVEAVHGAPRVGSIHIPDAVVEARPGEAVVVAVGPGNELPIGVGDRVYTNRYGGSLVRMGEKEYRLLEPEDLLAVVEN